MNTSTAAEMKPHAFLGASNYHWLGWSDEKLLERYKTHRAAQKGTELHELAENLIRLQVNLPDDGKTLSMYVNDAIQFKMETEVTLYYSEYCFGTADALAFDGYCLRIHDLKNGVTKTDMRQLYIYTALFCLGGSGVGIVNPYDISIILQIYQNNDILTEVPDPERIDQIMDRIQEASRILTIANAQSR